MIHFLSQNQPEAIVLPVERHSEHLSSIYGTQTLEMNGAIISQNQNCVIVRGMFQQRKVNPTVDVALWEKTVWQRVSEKWWIALGAQRVLGCRFSSCSRLWGESFCGLSLSYYPKGSTVAQTGSSHWLGALYHLSKLAVRIGQSANGTRRQYYQTESCFRPKRRSTRRRDNSAYKLLSRFGRTDAINFRTIRSGEPFLPNRNRP